MKYSDLALAINQDVNVIEISGREVEVLQYLPMMDKIDLIELALQDAKEGGIYNEMKLNMYFNLYIVFMYTNIEFTDEEKADLAFLYDELESNGIFDVIIAAMDEVEYEYLVDCMQTMKENYEFYNSSTASLIQTFIQDMPANAEAVKEIIDNFDKEKYKEVIDFAQSANGGRPI